MRLNQIKEQIATNTAAIKKLQSEISKLSQENVKLNNGYDDKLIEYYDIRRPQGLCKWSTIIIRFINTLAYFDNCWPSVGSSHWL